MTSVIEQKTRALGRFLRPPEVLDRTGLSRGTILCSVGAGAFSRGRSSLGARAVGWIEAEVDEWVRERIAESRSDAK